MARRARRTVATSMAVTTLVMSIGASVLTAASVIGLGIITAPEAGAYLGCPLGGGTLTGEVKVPGNATAVQRAENASYNGDLMTQNTPYPSNVGAGQSGSYLYCGKGVTTWPVEATVKYRINGPKVGKDLTGYLVTIFEKIPFAGGNEVRCTIAQEFGPKTVDPFYCSIGGHDSGSRYALKQDFTIGKKKDQTIADPHEQARQLASHCAAGKLEQCVFDPSHLNTSIYGPATPVAPAHDATCEHDSPYTFTWSQTVSTTENFGASATLGINIGKLVPIVQASVTATYGFSWSQSLTKSGTVAYTIKKGERMHILRAPLLNEVTGKFLLSGPADTNYVIPHATFKWADPEGTGVITPKTEKLAHCQSS